ncbi:CoA transferase [Sphingobium aromaticiconvertens]|uniref:CoA transferase n=1 Tax=Sphingobium aromaticiconvertens TaxID=365341 RepID=UPI003019456C
MTAPPAIPLSRWADAQLEAMAMRTGSDAIAALRGGTLLGERAVANGFAVPGRRSAGGGCRLYDTLDTPVALTLARADDRALLPALFGDATADDSGDAVIAERMARAHACDLVARGRMLGLAIAALDEAPSNPALTIMAKGGAAPVTDRAPLVIDLTALWAGPLAGHLLGLTGAQVIKVESRNRPDRMREGDPALFARLNQGKANIALDLREPTDRDSLIALIRRADIVLEAARPRALRQLGIDADQLVRETSGLVWVTITGHGMVGDAAEWIGFGDDCSVAGGLSAALRDATSAIGFGGDACADPLTGIVAARAALDKRAQGVGARLILSMSGVVAQALAEERAQDEATLIATLTHWKAAQGHLFPAIALRPTGPVASLGADNALWFPQHAPC